MKEEKLMFLKWLFRNDLKVCSLSRQGRACQDCGYCDGEVGDVKKKESQESVCIRITR